MRASAAILCIGTELTRGEIVDTNASWLAAELSVAGFEVLAKDAVPDDRDHIVAALGRLGAGHDVLCVTGGLGPTTDDITSECVATLLDVPLERDEASLAALTERLTRFGRTLAPSNAKQADFPRGAGVLPNPHGTAPGFSIAIGSSLAFFMPGVPREMKPMFEAHVLPSIAPRVRDAAHQIRIQVFGLAESTLNDRLAGIEAEHDVVIGYRAHFPDIEVKVLARAVLGADAERRARAAADEVRIRLGNIAYGEGSVSYPSFIGGLLRERGLRIALAESCTGGLVAELLTRDAGASDFFAGGAVVYANEAKRAVLGVGEALLATHGAVSAEVARAMAEGARRVFSADVGLSLTGIAGPAGGTPEKPVGLVHFAVATAARTEARHLTYPGERDLVRIRAAYAGLALVRELLGAS